MSPNERGLAPTLYIRKMTKLVYVPQEFEHGPLERSILSQRYTGQ